MQNNTDANLQYTFGGISCEQIHKCIQHMVEYPEYVVLNINKTTTSISMFNSAVIKIRINSKTQCLDIDCPVALDYVPDIPEATVSRKIVHIPLLTPVPSFSAIKSMIVEIYEYCRSQVSTETFGCCNDHIRCSDVGYCLHRNEKDYWGCYYRKNLESGRIFYGKNKNI